MLQPRSSLMRSLLGAGLGLLALNANAGNAEPFVNFESPHVHPLEMTPDGAWLLAVNTADHRLEVFSLAGTTPEWTRSIPVGLEPVSVRARTATEIWVINQISDSLSVIDLDRSQVVQTVATGDEPADVVFAGNPQRAFVSVSGADQVWVHPLSGSGATIVDIEGDHPRALATDGERVGVAILRSGNRTTVLGGGNAISGISGAFPPNVTDLAAGPYGGVNPPPNAGAEFDPPQRAGNPPPPRVAHLVRQRGDGTWRDDNDADWTSLVSGAQAAASGRVVGWEMLDHDVAFIDADALTLSYATGLTNIALALAVHPNGDFTLAGHDAINEVRFEPNLAGRFLRVGLSILEPQAPHTATTVDLNAHLDYQSASLPAAQRDLTLSDPRAIAWRPSGSEGFIAGMGSNAILPIDASGTRLGPPIGVSAGPTGLALDEARGKLYVLARFGATIDTIDLSTRQRSSKVTFYDPTPELVRAGRHHLYDARATSGTGLVSCASCHVDARLDGLAWDLGDPAGEVKPFDQVCDFDCDDWHPMKGPMVTQTLQDIIGKEPLHWRGDRFGIEEFGGAFESLLGDDEQLSEAEMAEFKSFLRSIYYPPNPLRQIDNTLSPSVPLPGHFTTGRFGAAGQPLPNGDAARGMVLFREENLNLVNCNDCHSLPTGMLPNFGEPGPNDELHHGILGIGNVSGITVKVPQLRNLADKRGFNALRAQSIRGFGYLHDGSVDSLERFVAEPIFAVQSDQDVADLLAFLFSLSGSDLPAGTVNDPEAIGTASRDAHAAVGSQWTIDATNRDAPETLARLALLQGLADDEAVGLIAKGRRDGAARGWHYQGQGQMQSDRIAEMTSLEALRLATLEGSELTLTAVPRGTEVRAGVDRDGDGFFDRDEIDAGSDPANATSTPETGIFSDGFESGDTSAW